MWEYSNVLSAGNNVGHLVSEAGQPRGLLRRTDLAEGWRPALRWLQGANLPSTPKSPADRPTGQERSINLWSHLFPHSLVASCTGPDQGPTSMGKSHGQGQDFKF